MGCGGRGGHLCRPVGAWTLEWRTATGRENCSYVREVLRFGAVDELLPIRVRRCWRAPAATRWKKLRDGRVRGEPQQACVLCYDRQQRYPEVEPGRRGTTVVRLPRVGILTSRWQRAWIQRLDQAVHRLGVKYGVPVLFLVESSRWVVDAGEARDAVHDDWPSYRSSASYMWCSDGRQHYTQLGLKCRSASMACQPGHSTCHCLRQGQYRSSRGADTGGIDAERGLRRFEPCDHIPVQFLVEGI